MTISSSSVDCLFIICCNAGMEFKTYFSALSLNDRQLFAKSVGSCVGHLNNCMYGYTLFNPVLCLAIERKTQKKVTRAELRPLDGYTIWPDVEQPEGSGFSTLQTQKLRTRKQRQYAIAHPAEVTPPRTHVNTATTGIYTGNAMGSARSDAGKVLPADRTS